MIKTRLRTKQGGFTLYELIVVAGIIGLLVSIILTRLDVSREKARDTKKVQELKALQTALELYQLEANSYPPAPDGASTANGDFGTILNPIVDSGYISVIPTPPQGSLVPGTDNFYYATAPLTVNNPKCGGKSLNELPYIIYFYTEQPTALPKLTLDLVDRNNDDVADNSDVDVPQETPGSDFHGYCLSL